MALAGVSDVYSASNDLFKAFLGIDMSVSQVYRVSSVLGHQINVDLAQEVSHPELLADEVIYGSMDGSMIFTDQGWQEVKVGRLFSSLRRREAGQKEDNQTRFRLEQSTYCAHLGSSEEFIPLFEASLGHYKNTPERLVFVTDGGVWIQRYLEENYPLATHILDYYHAVEHLASFSRTHFQKAACAAQWLDKQRNYLMVDGIDEVLSNLEGLSNLSRSAEESRREVMGYYQRNRHRMQYSQFQERGLQIGSGSMEAAHRTVVQCRMKRTGLAYQRAAVERTGGSGHAQSAGSS
ncbi:hypothetical protein [Arsenicibacter rosenii]|nr:hypothetical protein [Arsenicibacter rosenii]